MFNLSVCLIAGIASVSFKSMPLIVKKETITKIAVIMAAVIFLNVILFPDCILPVCASESLFGVETGSTDSFENLLNLLRINLKKLPAAMLITKTM